MAPHAPRPTVLLDAPVLLAQAACVNTKTREHVLLVQVVAMQLCTLCRRCDQSCRGRWQPSTQRGRVHLTALDPGSAHDQRATMWQAAS